MTSFQTGSKLKECLTSLFMLRWVQDLEQLQDTETRSLHTDKTRCVKWSLSGYDTPFDFSKPPKSIK